MKNSYFYGAGLILVVLLLAHTFRYAPLGGDAFDVVTVWDRWLHRVCVSSLAWENNLACSMDEMQRIASTQEQVAEIKKLRDAGFSEAEIAEHIKK